MTQRVKIDSPSQVPKMLSSFAGTGATSVDLSSNNMYPFSPPIINLSCKSNDK